MAPRALRPGIGIIVMVAPLAAFLVACAGSGPLNVSPSAARTSNQLTPTASSDAAIAPIGTTPIVNASPSPSNQGGPGNTAAQTTRPPTAAPTPTREPSQSRPPKLTPTPRPSPPAPTPVAPVTPGRISFGSAVDATGAIVDPHATFRNGELATWRADLKAAVGSTGLVWVIVQPLGDGREFEHWRQPLVITDPTLKVVINQLNLWLYCHNGAGTYTMRYTRGDGLVLAEGTFQLVP
jgi:hypothetical protein